MVPALGRLQNLNLIFAVLSNWRVFSRKDHACLQRDGFEVSGSRGRKEGQVKMWNWRSSPRDAVQQVGAQEYVVQSSHAQLSREQVRVENRTWNHEHELEYPGRVVEWFKGLERGQMGSFESWQVCVALVWSIPEQEPSIPRSLCFSTPVSK